MSEFIRNAVYGPSSISTPHPRTYSRPAYTALSLVRLSLVQGIAHTCWLDVSMNDQGGGGGCSGSSGEATLSLALFGRVSLSVMIEYGCFVFFCLFHGGEGKTKWEFAEVRGLNGWHAAKLVLE